MEHLPGCSMVLGAPAELRAHVCTTATLTCGQESGRFWLSFTCLLFMRKLGYRMVPWLNQGHTAGYLVSEALFKGREP